MATLTLRIATTGEEFEAKDIDFGTVTPAQLIDNMRDILPHNDNETLTLLKGSILVDQNETLDKVGFKDGDIAEIVGKVKGAKLLHV